MSKFIFFAFLAIISGVTCSPKIHVHTTIYDNKFKSPENQTFPYSAIDVHPTLNHLAFLIVGANDYVEITKNPTLHNDYRDLQDKIKYNHGAHLVLVGCFDFEARDLIHVDDFIRDTKGKKIRTFGYGIFNTNYTLGANLWEDDSVDLLLNEFMKKMHGNDFIRHEIPNSYITIFDPNPPSGRMESYLMNTINGRFESKIVVTFILLGGDKMDEFLKKKHHKEFLMDLVSNEFGSFGLVFLVGCYNFRSHFYLIADLIEHQKLRLVKRYRGPMKDENIRLYVQGRGLFSGDLVFMNKPHSKLIPNVEYPALEPFLDLYYPKSSKHSEYAIYDCNLNYVRQLGFEYVNGEYKPHANDDNFKFDAEAKVIKVVLITKKQFDYAIQKDYQDKGMLKQLLMDAQVPHHKVYVIVCQSEISTYPNVIESMLEYHLGSYLRKNVGEIWLNTPSTIGPIVREGDGGQFKVWPYPPIDNILGSP